MAAEPGIGWSDAEAAAQVEAYRAAVEETRGFGDRGAASGDEGRVSRRSD
jgi:hypothetical protein